MELTHVPPHNLEAEKAVIGAMLSSAYAIDDVISVGISQDSFFDEKNIIMFKHIKELHDEGVPVDTVTLNDYLQEKKMLEKAGGSVYISMLLESVPASSNVRFYAKIVNKKARERATINIARGIIDNVRLGQENIVEKAQDALQRVFEEKNKEVNRATNGIAEYEKMLSEQAQQGGVLIGISTGFSSIDKVTSGLRRGGLYILAAETSNGKSALATNIMDNVAANGFVLYLSLEMQAYEIVTNLVARRGKIDTYHTANINLMRKKDIENGTNNEVKMQEILKDLKRQKYKIIDDSTLRVSDVKALAREYKRTHGLKLLIVDHLHILYHDEPRGKSTALIYAETARDLKGLAQELDIPILVPCQVNRDKDRKGELYESDLKESGGIGQSATAIIMLYKESLPNSKEAPKVEKGINKMVLKFEKNRGGERYAKKNIIYIPQYCLFEEIKTIGEMREDY